MPEQAKLFYVYDPMCSWCWAYQPTLEHLRSLLDNAEIPYQALVGGLAPDTDQAMPLAMRHQIQSYWRQIEAKLGTHFNHEFWSVETKHTPRRATYPACRAIITARHFNKAELMNAAIQSAYYERAMNPSDDSILVQLASEIGCPEQEFSSLLNSAQTQVSLNKEIRLARSIGGNSFPSWILVKQNESFLVDLDYSDANTTFQNITELYGA